MEGLITGEGEYRDVNGTVMKGTWRAGVLHGKGVTRFVDGTIQSGVYRHGRLVGECTEQAKDDVRGFTASYTGAFKDGMKSGFGRIMYRYGEEYSGMFRHDTQHGWGVVRFI